MRKYYRVMPGRQSAFAEECFEGGFIGCDFGIEQDLAGRLPESWPEFNREFIPIYLAKQPGKSRVAAGLACGALWTLAKGMQIGDVVLCPDGQGSYRIGEVSSGYLHEPGGSLPHRRGVRWIDSSVARSSMSESLRRSAGSALTVVDLSRHADELAGLIDGRPSEPGIVSTDPEIEDVTAFAMERHLEDFLAANWANIELGREYDLWMEDGEVVGRQYPSDTGPMDLLAISKDRQRILVVELKRGRASDVVVGQLLRYMGYVKDVLAEPDQLVEGAVVAYEDDQRLRRALQVVPGIRCYLYKVQFSLERRHG